MLLGGVRPRPPWWLGTVLLEGKILCSVTEDVFYRGSSYIFAADKHEEAKCGLAAHGLGRPLFFPHCMSGKK